MFRDHVWNYSPSGGGLCMMHNLYTGFGACPALEGLELGTACMKTLASS
jgi:hypothetical protein